MSICAVIVTFHPHASVLASLAKVRSQAKGLVVVDNASSPESLALLRAAATELGFTLLEHPVNRGIAAALNTGVAWAKAQDYRYVLLFDQDSTVTEGFSDAMLAEYEAHPQRQKVAVVTPSQIEQSTGQTRTHRFARDGGPLVAITSGSLMPVTIFDQCGWFQENLIIDCVDHEYCLRTRSRGYTIAACSRAVLQVTVGATTAHRAFGHPILSRNYNARRRYYLTRNRLVMVFRYWKQQPAWCWRALKDIVQDAIKVVLVEEERASKMRNTARGIFDALFGRMGKVVEL